LFFGKKKLSPADLVTGDLFKDVLLSARYTTRNDPSARGGRYTAKLIYIVTCKIETFSLDKTNKITVPPKPKALAFSAQQRYGRTHRKGRFFLIYYTATNDSRNN
jgi:hypothetical protein